MKSLKFYGAIGGAVALIGCWPLAVGQIAQTAFEDIITSVDNNNLSVELIDYDRGYVSSTASSKVIVEAELAKQQLVELGLPTEFTVVHDISHGLISVSTNSLLDSIEDSAIAIHSKTQLNGTTDFDINYPDALLLELEDGATLEVPSWTMQGTMSPDESMQYTINTPLIRVSDDFGSELALTDAAVTATGNFNNQLWLGSQNFTVDNIVFVDVESGYEAKVTDVEYDLMTSLDDASQTYGTYYKLSLDGFEAMDVHADNIVLAMSASGFDAHSVEKLAFLSSGNPIDDAQLGELLDTLMFMLANGVSLEQEQFSFEYGNGSFSSAWNLNWPEQKASKDVFEMLMAVEGDFSAYITKPLVESFPMIEQVVDELMVMEIMTDDDQGYQLRGKIVDSNVEFENGQKIPLLMLVMTALSNSGQ